MGNSFALPFSCCSFKPPATAHLCCFSAEPVTAYTCSSFLLIVAAHLPAYPHSLFRAAAKVMDAALISQPALHPSIHSSSLCVAGSEAPVLGSSPGSLTSLHKTRMVPHCFPPPHCPFSSPLLLLANGRTGQRRGWRRSCASWPPAGSWTTSPSGPCSR